MGKKKSRFKPQNNVGKSQGIHPLSESIKWTLLHQYFIKSEQMYSILIIILLLYFYFEIQKKNKNKTYCCCHNKCNFFRKMNYTFYKKLILQTNFFNLSNSNKVTCIYYHECKMYCTCKMVWLTYLLYHLQFISQLFSIHIKTCHLCTTIAVTLMTASDKR